jgi:hypothetical protein
LLGDIVDGDNENGDFGVWTSDFMATSTHVDVPGKNSRHVGPTPTTFATAPNTCGNVAQKVENKEENDDTELVGRF